MQGIIFLQRRSGMMLLQQLLQLLVLPYGYEVVDDILMVQQQIISARVKVITYQVL